MCASNRPSSSASCEGSRLLYWQASNPAENARNKRNENGLPVKFPDRTGSPDCTAISASRRFERKGNDDEAYRSSNAASTGRGESAADLILLSATMIHSIRSNDMRSRFGLTAALITAGACLVTPAWADTF